MCNSAVLKHYDPVSYAAGDVSCNVSSHLEDYNPQTCSTFGYVAMIP
jgi:hypothetical protein